MRTSLLLVVALTVGGWGCERRMTPVGPTKLRGRIIFQGVYNFIPQIFSIYPDELEEVHRVTNTRFDDVAPRWSPDGTRIAFLSNRRDAIDFFRLYVMNADGSNVTGLFNPAVDPPGDLEFAWAPDGRHIALINQIGGLQLFILNMNTLERRLMASAPPNRFAPDWSPDGTRIAFVSQFRGNSISTLHILSYPDLTIQALDVGFTTPHFPRWSPDGKSLAFIASPSGPPRSYQIYVAETVGFAVRQVTTVMGGISSTSPLAWSPDSQKLVFSAPGMNSFDVTSRDLYSISVDGTQFVRLTTNPTDESAPDWTSHD